MLESNQNCITNPLSKEVIQQLKINISYSIRGSEIKKINVLVNGQADAEQTDFFVIKQILMKEAPELNLKNQSFNIYRHTIYPPSKPQAIPIW